MISKVTIQVINALRELSNASTGEYKSVAFVAKRINAPQEYLGKMLQRFVREQIVSSQKGLNGGYSLAKKPDEIRLYDIVSQIEDLSRLEGCFMGRSVCSNEESCAAHKRWEVVRKTYKEFLLNTTIADLK